MDRQILVHFLKIDHAFGLFCVCVCVFERKTITFIFHFLTLTHRHAYYAHWLN